MIGFDVFGYNIDALVLIYPVILFLLFVGYRYILLKIRKKTDAQLNHLLYETEQFDLYQLLLTNKRLKWVYSKNEFELLKLNGFMAESDDVKIILQIKALDQINLNPKLKLDFMSKRFTYFVEIGKEKEANLSYKALVDLLKMKKHPEAKKILVEADTVLQIYIKKDVKLIPELIKKADTEKNSIVQGVIYFRIAKLYYFDKKTSDMKTYLYKASKQLRETYYEEIINKALVDPSILNTK